MAERQRTSGSHVSVIFACLYPSLHPNFLGEAPCSCVGPRVEWDPGLGTQKAHLPAAVISLDGQVP